MLQTKTHIGIDAKRIIVVDPSLTDFTGHHAQYDISVIESARGTGIEGLVIAHNAIEETICGQIPVIKGFSEDMWGGVRLCTSTLSSMWIFLLGVISIVVFPPLAVRRIAQLRRWIALITKRLSELNVISSGARSKPAADGVRAMLRTRTLTVFRFIARAATRLGEGLKKITFLCLPPIFFILLSPAKVLRLLTPKLFVDIAKGAVGLIGMNNWLGKIAPGFALFLMENQRYYVEARSALKRAGVGRGDLVFFHMVIGRNILETAVLCHEISRKTGIPPILLFRYPPSFLYSAHRFCLRSAIRKIEHLFESGRIRLASDSNRLIEEYTQVTYAPFELFPIPHGKTCQEFDQSNRGKDKPPERITIASLGNARGEKGFVEIVQLMGRLAETGIKDNVQFAIQANDPDADAQLWVEFLASQTYPFPVSIITKTLNQQEYEDLVASSDMILAPYWREIYASRTSGVALEALVGGKILITTENTWMSDEVHIWESGLTVKNRNITDLMQTVVRAVNNYDCLKQQATAASRRIAQFHSGTNFVNHLLRRCHSRVITGKEVLFLYPWGNLFAYNSGASMRSSLLAKAILNVGWSMVVVGSTLKDATIPPHVRFVHFEGDAGSSFSNPLYVVDFIKRLIISPQLVGMEDFQYRFNLWCRSREFKLLLNSTLRGVSAIVLEYEFLASLLKPYADFHCLPFIVDSHDVLAFQTSRRALRKWLLQKEITALRASTYPCCISQEDKGVFDACGISVNVVENSIDLDRSKLPNKDRARAVIEQAGVVLPSENFVLFVGSSHPPNIVAAKRVAEMSRSRLLVCHEIAFVTIGSCYQQDLEDYSPNFLQLGVVTDEVLHALYALCSFVVIPLESGTGSSIKTIEALSFGKPVIGTSIAFRGIPVTKGKHCIIPDNISDFPLQIVDLLNNPDAVLQLQDNARALAATRDYRITSSHLLNALSV